MVYVFYRNCAAIVRHMYTKPLGVANKMAQHSYP